MKLQIHDIGGDVVKDNDVYLLRDNKTLNNLVLSQTILHPKRNTNGHRHSGQEEVYFFVFGKGKMVVADDENEVKPEEVIVVQSGDIVLIPDGKFHKVYNTGESDLIFNCVFDGKRNH